MHHQYFTILIRFLSVNVLVCRLFTTERWLLPLRQFHTNRTKVCAWGWHYKSESLIFAVLFRLHVDHMVPRKGIRHHCNVCSKKREDLAEKTKSTFASSYDYKHVTLFGFIFGANGRHSEKKRQKKVTWETKLMQWGPILRKSYYQTKMRKKL